MRVDNNINFKSGLTRNEINAVKNMSTSEFHKLSDCMRNKYKMNINVANSKTVLWCLYQTSKIMTKAGFNLPKNFNFTELSDKTLGTYSPLEDEVCINSNCEAFYNLELQNLNEECQGNYHPKTKHFLSTYIHEFLHAAHFHNLVEKNDIYNVLRIWKSMTKKQASEYLVGPINGTIKSLIPINAESLINQLFPPSNGLYSKTDLLEYFAERNLRVIAERLGNNYNVENIRKDISCYEKSPKNWDFTEEFKKALQKEDTYDKKQSFIGSLTRNFLVKTMSVIDCCEKEIEYINRDIWDGDIKSLIIKSLDTPERGAAMNLMRSYGFSEKSLNKIENILDKYTEYVKSTDGITFEDFDLANFLFSKIYKKYNY